MRLVGPSAKVGAEAGPAETETPPVGLMSWGGVLGDPSIRFMFVELRRDERGERVESGVGVGTKGFKIKPGTAFGGQAGEIENTLAVEGAPLVVDFDLGLKLVRQPHEFIRRPEVETQGVDNFDLTAGDGIMGHRQLGRPFGDGGSLGNAGNRRRQRGSKGMNRDQVEGTTRCGNRPRRCGSGGALVGFVEQFLDLLPRLGLSQETHEPFVLQMPGDVLQGPEMVPWQIRG